MGLGLVLPALAYVWSHDSFRIHSGLRTGAALAMVHVSPPAEEPFPDVELAQLTPQRAKVIQLLQSEYAKHPVSFDQSVLTYTQGNKEAWCADFVSWTMRQVGTPLTNPHSGGWRIPGVYTLQEYFQAHGRYAVAGDYLPQPGDAAFFITGNSSHVSFVVKVEGGNMVTLGGNEGGRMRLSTHAVIKGEGGLTGFGKGY